MQSVLFDTSIYITALRLENEAPLGFRRIAAGAPAWLSTHFGRESVSTAALTSQLVPLKVLVELRRIASGKKGALFHREIKGMRNR